MVYSWREGQTPWDFWRNRILRIYPMYWLALGLLLALIALRKFPFGLSTYTSEDFLSSFFLYAQKPSNGSNYPLLPPAWTLVCEIYFYLLFGLCLGFKTLPRIIGALGLFFLICLGIWLVGGSKNYTISTYTNPIIFEFLIGNIMALAYRNSFAELAIIWLRKWGHLAATLLIAAGITCIFANQNHVHGILSSEEHFTYFAMPATLLVGGLLFAERAGLQFKSQWFFLLGSASYAIYLFHLLFFEYGLRALGRFLPSSGNFFIEAINAMIGIGLAIVGGVCIHLWIERPLMNKLRSMVHSHRHVTTPPPASRTS